MTPQQKLIIAQIAWRDQITHITGNAEQAKRIVEMADLNGLFDIHKHVFGAQELLIGRQHE